MRPSTLFTGAAQGDNVALDAADRNGYAQISIASTGVATIKATFGNAAATALTTGGANSFVQWSRTAAGVWTCATGSGVAAKFRPNGCLGQI
ncbi:MAG: pilin [Rubrivivax sp.]